MKRKTSSVPIQRKPAAKKAKIITAFPIVAIGASAGGLEAITELLKNLSPNTGMAFIYVQHLSPEHKSLLTSLLSKVASMKVQEVKNKVLLAPNNLYVIPPDKEINVSNGHLRLTPRPDSPKFNLPIDVLFSSLAAAHKENIIGIILSGNASDGTNGMKSIKNAGGLTFAQDDSAKFKSMPKSAIVAGAVDFILSPKEIAAELNRMSIHGFLKTNGIVTRKGELIDNTNPELKDILNQLRKATGVDFSAYKMQTIKRRIVRRMLLNKFKTLKDYARLLHEKKEELDHLYQDLLINVTSFFRETDTHKYLKTSLLPKLLKSRNKGEELRIWVPACSTGEEAFSIAMMLLELQESRDSGLSFHIFATDLSAPAIRKARIGLYSKKELETVSPRRLQRFFTKSDSGYRIAKTVRDSCVFAPHNILSDPPFSRLDFISCRNLFIYLDTPAQNSVLKTFHFALKDRGYLMLGKSESINAAGRLFTAFNKKFKVFSRKNDSDAGTLPTRLMSREVMRDPLLPRKSTKNSASKTKFPVGNTGLDNAIDTLLVNEYMPACVVINQQMEILQFRGATGLYLTPASGKASFNILKMARPEIAFVLRNAVSKALHTKQRVTIRGIAFKSNARRNLVNLEVVPLKIEWDEPLILVLFSGHQQIKNGARFRKEGKYSSPETARKIKKLEEELAAARSDAHIFSQEQEVFIEELQSANEEVVSSNEELQTVNEELQTSKEEIESANEELMTTNQELQTRNDLLNESYDYSHAIISTLHEPMIVLDKDLRVKTASRSFYKKFGVREDETEGALLYDLGNKQWNIPRLRKLLEDIVPKNSYFHDFQVTHTFPDIGKKILMLNASRIVQKSHGEQLILLSISDITDAVMLQLKEKELLNKDIRESRSYNLKLEKAVKERTKELKQTNITLAEKFSDLEKMNKELQAFTYASSHDLQEPLRKIQTFAGRILEKEIHTLSDNGKNYFRHMQNSARGMQLLIMDLLAFSRLNTAERKFEFRDLHNIVTEVKAEFKDHITESRAVIKVSSTCNVRIIPFQFRQLIHNLFSNAFKFSRPGIPPCITITCRIMKTGKKATKNLLPHKNYCHICVADNGIGFEQEFSEKIFEVFEKLHSKDEYAGTGIGLAIVKKIVENHHGIIIATSKINKGSTFDIFIPAF